MNKPISINNAPHFTWGEGCDGWWLKQGGRFTVITEVMPPGSSEKNHYHQHTEQFFYCLKGRLVIRLKDHEVTLSEQEGYTIAPQTTHQVKNIFEETAYFLVISSTNSHTDRLDLE